MIFISHFLLSNHATSQQCLNKKEQGPDVSDNLQFFLSYMAHIPKIQFLFAQFHLESQGTF